MYYLQSNAKPNSKMAKPIQTQATTYHLMLISKLVHVEFEIDSEWLRTFVSCKN
jgi:hypothetical protein